MKYFPYFLLFFIFSLACSKYYFRENYRSANSLMHSSPQLKSNLFLKAHLKNGEVILFQNPWKIDTFQNRLIGIAERYDSQRKKIYNGETNLPIDSILIFETNKILKDREDARVLALGIQTLINVGMGIYCFSNPKACFGSCPTFYINDQENLHRADAEGFSNAISPSLEYSDIDALSYESPIKNEFNITMKNEAFETHCVNSIKLYAYPKNENEEVFQSKNNEFFLCKDKIQASHVIHENQKIKSLISKKDYNEWFSEADPYKIHTKEEVYLEFNNDNSKQDLGLIINFRQSLMTTYFIYNAISYMGDEVSDYFAKLESNREINKKLKDGIFKELGNIDVYYWNSEKGKWILQDGFNETGPIAFNQQILPLHSLSKNDKAIKLKIVLNKGLWRIDYLGLTHIMKKVNPVELQPSKVEYNGAVDPNSLLRLKDDSLHLISLPGDEYNLHFDFPDSESKKYSLFLCSKGYYLEWMREHWLKDKNPLKLYEMIYLPKKYLKDEAQAFKNYEKSMEEIFWNSKINTKSFSYDEL